MTEQKEAQTQMIEIPKPGNSEEKVLVDPADENLPGWQKRTVELMKEKGLSAKEALAQVRKQDAKEEESDRWFD